ncbi:hypothetical protein [Streptomyces scabichelini]|uniref:hypothetical protein n=1 Tax=Streptomyces scabichelini TaxID=2711217 RepID=UPI0030BA0081
MSKFLVVRLPAVGTLVLDTATGRTGKFMGLPHGGSTRVMLRPEHGGKEWEADPEKIVPVEVAP